MKSLYHFGSFVLDPNKRDLHRDGKAVPLTSKAFDLLLYLVQNPNRAVSKEELMQGVWADSFVEEGNLTQNVFLLRKALAEESGESAVIVTIPRKGYQFAAEVTAENGTELVAANTELAEVGNKAIVRDVQEVTRIVLEEETEDETELLSGKEFKELPAPAGGKWRRGTVLLAALVTGAAAAAVVWIFVIPQSMPRVLRTVQLTHFGRAEPSSPVLTDGSRLYFTERIGGSWWLSQVAEDGGDPDFISTSVKDVELLDIVRSRSKLLVGVQAHGSGSTDPLWVVPTRGGSAQRLGDATGSEAAWSPDAQSLAYGRENALFEATYDGRQPRKLFSASGTVEHLRWSPDGRRLSFSVMDQSTALISLWEISSDGSNPHRLYPDWKSKRHSYGEGECCGDWSPDGKYFVFRSQHDGVASLWAARQGGKWWQRRRNNLVQLYTSPDHLSEPRFGMDGKKIFFVDYQSRRELVRYDSTRKLFVPYLGGIPARHLTFSRDGKWVAYRDEGDGNLWRSRTDGTEALQLSFPPLEPLHSTWSPDGKKIAFAAGGTLYQVPFEGGKPERLLPENSGGSQPSWSPNGQFIVFVRAHNSEDGARHPAINVLDLKTGQDHMIPGSDDFEGPQWSPDGKYLAISDQKNMKLMLLDWDRQEWSILADGLPYGWGIRWAADGRYVYYQHLYEGEEQPIYRVRVSDRKVEQITSARQILRADVLGYSMTGLTPDDSPLASLIRRNSDVYALELELP